MEPFAVVVSSRKESGSEPTPDYIMRITPDGLEATGRPGTIMVRQAEAATARVKIMGKEEWAEEYKDLVNKYKEIYSRSGYGTNTDVFAYSGKNKKMIDDLVEELNAARIEKASRPPRKKTQRSRVGAKKRSQ